MNDDVGRGQRDVVPADSSEVPTFAYFISPHGFGHATRSCAVIEALFRRWPGARFEIFTTVPRWLFEDSLRVPFRLHAESVDVGVVQRTPIDEDLPATLAALAPLLPPRETLVNALADRVRACDCAAVISDIAPIGLAVGERAALPTVLVENFTWDWIYRPYVERFPRFARHIACIEELVGGASLHVQTTPVCRPVVGAIKVRSVARRPRRSRAATRASLAIPPDDKLVLVTMGGAARSRARIEEMVGQPMHFVVAGEVDIGDVAAAPNVHVLPQRSPYYHPDLVHAADAVVGKLGYSTLAEALDAGVRYAYVERPGFVETAVLEAHLQQHLPSLRLSPSELESGFWVERIPPLLEQEAPEGGGATGAEEIAAAIGVLLCR